MEVTNLIAEEIAVKYEVAKAKCDGHDFKSISITLEHAKKSAIKAKVVCEKDVKKNEWLMNMVMDPVKSNHIMTMGATNVLKKTIREFVENFILNEEKKLEV